LKGLDRFLIAHHFLWTYPRNAKMMADQFNICETYAAGHMLWHWIGKLSALKEKKIVWMPSRMDNPSSPTFICSLDGTGFRVWEKKHPTLPQDRRQMSHKFKHGALKYEIAVCNYYSQVCWIGGPHGRGKHDLMMFREGGLKGPLGAMVNNHRYCIASTF
jgi:hypothetical protein